MKILTLIRHGKSSWGDTSLSDWERPLNKRGKKDSVLIGSELFNKGIIPDQIVSSSAKRAYGTAKRIAKCVKYPESEIIITDNIYSSGFQPLIEIIRNLNDDWEHVFLFGHNPYFTSIANHFGKTNVTNLPTAGVFQISFICKKWSDVSKDNSTNILFLTPRMLK